MTERRYQKVLDCDQFSCFPNCLDETVSEHIAVHAIDA